MTLQLLPFPAADYAAWRDAQVERRLRWQFGPLWSDAAAAAAQARIAVDELAPAEGLSGTHLLRVLSHQGEVGWVWLSRQDGDLLVLDADVRAPAGELLALLEAHARAGDATCLLLDRMVAAPTPAALAAEGGFTVVSQTMTLRLAGGDDASGARAGGPASPPVILLPMSETSFDAYLGAAIDEYAREIQQADEVAWDEALTRSHKDYEELLPRGLDSDGHVLLDVLEATTHAHVGALWLGLRPPSAAFVYDVHVHPAVRGRGLGRAAMSAGAEWCRARGIEVLGLSVFGRNEIALGLYDSLGYEVVVEALRRPVEPAPPVVGPR
ncbi:GNAT family N-acetyltransferase [Xylanimonas sp. McL0601]|uniref:GNAT family N-acetyltransferase n=1 Tax=Xylanimonas sp. McL0601 TaxID=3414739 RepID=UPI003CF046F7